MHSLRHNHLRSNFHDYKWAATCRYGLGAIESSGQPKTELKAAQHCRTPKPCGVWRALVNPTGFGVRQCCAALDLRRLESPAVLIASSPGFIDMQEDRP